MDVKKIVFLFYTIYTVYIIYICGVTNIEITDILAGVVFLWIIYGLFVFGASLSDKLVFKTNVKVFLNTELSVSWWVAFSLLSFPFAIIAAKFYTGNGPLQVFSNIINGVSNYYSYQQYFSKNSIDTLAITSKAPYIIMMFWVKASMIYGCVRLLLHWEGKKIKRVVVFIICVLPHFYIALARGTNFEYYEFTILMIFIILYRIKSEFSFQKIGGKAFKSLLICLVLGIVLISVYSTVIEARGFVLKTKITRDIYYEPDSYVAQLMPQFSYLMVNFFNYLGFGIFYVSSFVNKVWLGDITNFFAGFVFGGFSLFGAGTTTEIMKTTIDMSSNWHPDLINFINDFGIIGVIILVMALGYISQRIYTEEQSIWKDIGKYLIILQMLSLPVGNFILCSSANKLLVLMVAFFLVFGKKKDVHNG